MITWQQFINLPVNKKLSLKEQKTKFLLENTKLLTDLEAIEAMYGAAGAAGGFSGTASDGPISGATVTAPGAGTAITDAAGRFTLPAIPTQEITVTGGTDSITGVAFTGELKGFPQYEVISPMTTLAYHLKEETKGTRGELTTDGAIDLLFASSSTLFGIDLAPEDKDVMLKKDYVAESVLGDSQQAVAAQSIATYLESVTEMVGSAVKGVDQEGNFTNNNAKVQGYKSIARQIRDTSGAKTAINPELLFEKVTKPDGSSFDRLEKIETSARQTIKSQLDSVRAQLDTLARSQAFTSNYLTTQIQAINRGVKEQYVTETANLVQGRASSFDNMNVLIARSTGSLAQIEDGKRNDTDATNSKRPPAERFILGTHGESITITQEEKTDKGIETYTLTFEEEIGDYFVIGSGAQRGQTILGTGINDNPIAFADYANYRKSAPTIKILATSKKDDKGNVLQIILSNPGLVIISTQFVDNKTYLPVAKGGYALQNGSQMRPGGPIKWTSVPAEAQPFTASIDANQESATATISDKRGSRVHDIEYNSSTSRFEYSTTQNPPKGAKIMQAYITNFTHEAQWTTADGIKALGLTRFQINNHDTYHIDGSEDVRYTLVFTPAGEEAGETQNMETVNLLGGLRLLSLTAGKTQFKLEPMDAEIGPNGPFRFVQDKETLTQDLQFTNDVCQFTTAIGRQITTVTITRISGRG